MHSTHNGTMATHGWKRATQKGVLKWAILGLSEGLGVLFLAHVFAQKGAKMVAMFVSRARVENY